MRLLVLTAGALWVRDGDSVDLGACALPGLIRTAVSEHPTMRVRQLDLPADDGEWAQAVRRELADRNHAGVVAARDGRRWQPKLTPLAETETETVTAPVRTGGRYLVTGGLGGLAVEIAGHLLAAYGVRLLLVGRSTVDGAKADRLAELSALGDVDYVQADVADAGALEAAVASAEARWGHGLDGVLHLAAADPTGQWAELERHTLANEAAATFAEQYRPKVSGTLAVAAVLDRRPDASLVLFGSVNGEFGGNSFGAYAAASCFLVGFAEYWRHERRRSVKCLAWSMWTDVGVNAGRPVEAARRRGFRAIDPDAGLRLFLDAMAAPGHYLLLGLDLANPTIVADLGPGGVHAGELLVAYAPDGVDPGVVRAAIAAGIRDAVVPVRLVALPRIPRGVDGSVDTERLLLDTAPGRRRRTPAAPRSDLEREIAGVWSAALGRTAIGRDDSFFELGGNSLRATRLLALVDDRLGVRVSTQELYESPTVAGMAAAVRERRLVNSKESAR
ncbi:SDR family NAD(P)-dependent oxidoreductase [Kutzneria sp. 744]|uniref:SDR family NAD(P)-dependent oxidoreductase n=1 Tax=Kutzneria sp. (strain 744) TaxID=345341 RepID=UPI0003EEC35E|nr:SDR family NAD(P)-dependent oxidoreductase [Kutzneria sp. 744]EWM18608.1 phosphopantetheine attachment site [Kutzneria sp. 744]